MPRRPDIEDRTRTESFQPGLFTRILEWRDTELFPVAVTLHNSRWEQALAIKVETFQTWVNFGIVFGIFDGPNGPLIGTLACNRLHEQNFNKAKTYDQITAGGTLENFSAHGTILVPFSITLASSSHQPINHDRGSQQQEEKLRKLATEHIHSYASGYQGHALAFHHKSKGGLGGATILEILPEGRPEDISSMGYNVTLQYPILQRGMKIEQGQKPSHRLIEEAMMFCLENGISRIAPFSRPSGFREHLLGVQG